jgi:hypothetical protein
VVAANLAPSVSVWAGWMAASARRHNCTDAGARAGVQFWRVLGLVQHSHRGMGDVRV